ncbi:hypothetical protein KIN20_013224 [Parelaphostrongylus tenuis]|uniref:Uncharacterized protein n=1 Tax=Parelaphostrongylus tenuis TaxID=148309 RepID=A0AAD5MUE2_PARTN|nr:hypothetical protein KIN20_013224 [Parelaphostrongylus tenuis]
MLIEDEQSTFFIPPSSDLLARMHDMPHCCRDGRTSATSMLGGSGGSVRRRGKGPTSMPSSCEGSSPQQNLSEDVSGCEQKAQHGKENHIIDNSRKVQQSTGELRKQ